MDKYITISNKQQYINNKNGEFTADILYLDLNKKYKLGVSEFIYCNKIKINLGTFNLDIVTHTKSSYEYINHLNFMSKNNLSIKNLSIEITTLLEDLIKNIKKPPILLDDFSESPPIKVNENDVKIITKNTNLIVEKLKELKNLFELLNNHIYDHKKYNFDYYFYAESQCFIQIRDFIKNNKTRVDSIILIEFENLEINKTLTEIINLNNQNKETSFNITHEFIAYDKWTIEDVYGYIKLIYKNQLEKNIMKLSLNKTKLTIYSDALLRLSYTKLFSDLIKVELKESEIIFELRRPISYIKNIFIYTDIIESNEVSGNTEKLLQIIKPEGEYQDTNTKSYTRPTYSKLNRTYLSTINISLLDQNKNIILFEEPPSIKLHIIETK